MNSVSSVLKKNWGPSPALPVGEGEIGAPPQPSPVGRERLARWELAEFKRLVMWVRSFRVISCRDAASVLSRCAEWCSVNSVSSVLKKNWGPSPALPVGEGEASAVGHAESRSLETSDVGAQFPCHQLPRRGLRSIKMCRMVFCEFRVFRVKKKLGPLPGPPRGGG